MAELSDAQREAVEADGHLLITAAPGSGKTFTLAKRAARLLERGDGKLVAVTFTREAALSIKERIAAECPQHAARVEAGTFHNLCGKQLKDNSLGRPLIDALESTRRIAKLYNEAGGAARVGCPLDEVIEQIGLWKSVMSPELNAPAHKQIAQIYHAYQDMLDSLGRMDFADMVLRAARGMQDGTVKPMQAAYMLVDEAQDIDEVQLSWILSHAETAKVTIVGDDDQSIYGWRSALGYGGMVAFQAQTGAKHVTLDTTFRCPSNVLEPAARLIAHNKERVEKRLRSLTDGGLVTYRTFASRKAEVDALCEAVIQSGDPTKWAVLVRTKIMADNIEALVGGRIRLRRDKGDGLWEIPPTRLLLRCLRSLARNEIDGFDALISEHGAPTRVVRALASVINYSQPGSLARFLEKPLNELPDHPAVLRVRALARDWVPLWAAGHYMLAIYGIWMAILSGTPMIPRRLMPQPEKPDKTGATRSNPVSLGNSIMDAALRHLTTHTADKDQPNKPGVTGGPCNPTVKPWVLLQRIENLLQGRDGKEDSDPAVLMMTLHSSKGLEFDSVWLPAVEDGTLPFDGSPVPEERRLFYVGMTRAKRQLFVSAVSSANNAGKVLRPSDFIYEAGFLHRSMFGNGQVSSPATLAS